jgi:DNA-binding MarR family transcriptional regulator
MVNRYHRRAMESERTADDEALLAAARLITGISVRAADEADGLSPVQLRALTVLAGGAGANLASLAEAMGVAVSTASRLVDRLVAAGWVDRRPSAADRREISLSLTGGGTAALTRYDDLRLRVLRERLGRLPAARRAAVVAALRDLSAD